MAAKLNKRFLATVLVVSAVVILVVGGGVFYMIRMNPERNIRTGEDLMAAGDYEAAAKEFGRAVSKESGNEAYLAKYEEALLKITPETSQRAFELYSQWISVLSTYSQLKPMDEAPARRLLEEIYGNARLTNMKPMWDTLQTAARQVLERNQEMTLAEFYAVVAKDQQRNFITTSESDVQAIQAELERQVNEHPDDPRRLHALLFSQLQLAYRDFIAGRRSENNRFLVRALELAEQSAERFPESLELANLRARTQSMLIVLARSRNAAEDERRELTDALLERLNRIWELASTGDYPGYVVIESAEVLSRFGGRRESQYAITLLEDHLQEDPNALFHRYILSRLYFDQQNLQRAEEEAQKLLNVEPLSTSFLAQLRFDVQQGAAKMLFDVSYAKYDGQPDTDEGRAALARAREVRDRLAEMYADPSQSAEVAVCDAWLALADRNFAEAAGKFEFAISQQPEPEFRTYVGAARALEGRNEPGAARQRLLKALELQPSNSFVMMRLARVNFALGDFAQAESYADAALQVNPDSTEAMAVRMEARRAQNKEVEVDAVSGPLLAINQAREQRNAGDTAKARATLEGAIAEYPGVPALRLMIIELEANAGNKEAALAQITAFRDAFPGSAAEADLIRIEGLLQGRDPIDIVRDVVERTTPKETDRPIRLFITFADLARSERTRADQLAAQGNAEQAATARGNAEKYQRAADQARADAERVSADHPALLEFRFREALTSNNWQQAERIVLEAREKNADRANGRIFEGRLAMARGRFVDAAAVLLDATRLQPHDSDTWRLLGRCYEEVGNVVDAVKAYASAYERNPNDPQTIRFYANLLMQTGRNVDALNVLRASKDVLAGDSELRDARLTLEAQFGSPSTAIRERREAYKESPQDVSNAIRLALLLGSATPSREDVVDPATGAPRFSETIWTSIQDDQKRSLLNDVRLRWVAEGQTILDKLAASEAGQTLDVVVARAYFLRDQGKVSEGEQVLRTFVESQRPPTVASLLRLAEFQGSAGRISQAISTMEAALAFQDPEQREADAALARAHFSQAQFERAKRHYQAVQDATPSRETMIRLIECDINLRNFAEASSRLDRLIAEDETAGRSPVESLLLGAAIDRGAAADLAAAGKTNEAALRLNEEMKKLDRAVEMAPSATAPLLQRAQAKRRQFVRENRANANLLESALLDLNKAISIQAGYLPAHVAKAEVFMTQSPPDTRSAIETLSNVLQLSPREDDIRQSLVTLLVGTGQRPQAIRVVQAAIDQFPSEARWHEALGDLYAQAVPPIDGGMERAQRSYEEAFRLRPTRELLVKQCRALLSMKQRDPARVIRLTDTHEEMLKATPLLRCYRAMAQSLRPNGRSLAESEFAEAYSLYKAAIAQGNAPRSAIGEWFVLVGEAFPALPIDEVESIIRRIIAGELTSHEYEQLAELHYRRGSSRSVDFLKRAIELASADDTERKAQLMFRVGSVHQAYGQYQEAVDLYEQIRTIWPDHAATLNNLAFIYAANMGQAAKAEPIARRALELAPGNYNVLDTMGAVLLGLEKFEEAERHLLRSVQLRAEPGNLLHLAKVYAKTNRGNQARQTLQEALKLNPDPATEREIRQLLDDMSRTGS